MTDTLYVYSDGAVRGKRRVCMIGYVVQDEASNTLAHSAKFNGHGKSSTQCEIEAAIYAIGQVYRQFKISNIVLFTDSKDVEMREHDVIAEANVPAKVEIHWVPRDFNPADNEINTFALKKHVPKSRKRVHYELVAALAK